jgi:hypothetical protein
MMSRRRLNEAMKALSFAVSVLFVFLVETGARGDSRESVNAAREANSIAKGAVHLPVGSDAEARQNFVYFPYPTLPTGFWTEGVMRTGVYRLEVNPQGQVTAVRF